MNRAYVICHPMLIRIILVAAIAVMVWLLVWQGFSQVLSVIVDFGWNFLWLLCFFLLAQILATLSWQQLFFDRNLTPSFARLYLANWLGTSVNSVLPLASLSGEAARARVLMTSGISGSVTGVSILLNKTVEALSLVFMGGLASILVLREYGVTLITLICTGGWLLLATGVLLFIILQRQGILGSLASRWQGRIGSKYGQRVMHGLTRADAAIRFAYHQPRHLINSLLYMLLYRLAMITELYLLFVWAGNLLTWQDALIVDGLGAALKGLAFIVPAGIGIQEASYMALGAIAGALPAVMLALSLIRRARDIAIGLPILMWWQIREGRMLLDRSGSVLPSQPE